MKSHEPLFQMMSPDMINKKNQLRLSANMSCLNEFELQIKQLECSMQNAYFCTANNFLAHYLSTRLRFCQIY